MSYECDCMYYFFLLLKNTKCYAMRLRTSMWITSKIPEAHSVSCHFLNHMKHRGWHGKVHILVTSAQTFPNWYIAQLPLTHFQDRALKELQAPQCAQNSPTELNTYSIEHQQYLYFSLAEWTTKSFQSLLLLLWHLWPLLKVKWIAKPNSAIKMFFGLMHVCMW